MKKLLTLVLALAIVFGCAAIAPSSVRAEEEPLTITMMVNAWNQGVMPAKEDDVIRAYLYELYNTYFDLSVAYDADTEFTLAFASGNPPDFVQLNEIQLKKFYNEELLTEDWNAFQDALPDTFQNMSDAAKTYFTQDGNLICTTTKYGDQVWTMNIRADWLETLGIDMPTADTTIDEMLDIARKFTFDDPDGDGVDNTYAFSSAGSSTSIGEIRNLLNWFGPTTWDIDAEGNVTHPIITGYYDDFCEMMHTIVSEGLIDPDWYTQQWDERKPNMAKKMFGILYYPNDALTSEIASLNGLPYQGSEETSEEYIQYKNMYKILPCVNNSAIPAEDIVTRTRTCSYECGQDAAKMAVICQFLEDTAYPNFLHNEIYYGFAPLGLSDISYTTDDGKWIVGTTKTQEEYDAYQALPDNEKLGLATALGLWNYCQYFAVYNPAIVNMSPGITTYEEMPAYKLISPAVQAEGLALPHYSQYGLMVSNDATAQEESNLVRDEYLFNRIMGTETQTYEEFVQAWLAAGGQEMYDNAVATFQSLGLIP